MVEKNYYKVLGVSKTATEAEIKRAFRKLVRKYHPDVSDDPNADEIIAELNNAYETLGDPDKRAEYDRMQSSSFTSNIFTETFNNASQKATQGFKWEDIKDQFGEGSLFGSGSFRFDDVFSAFGYTGKTREENKAASNKQKSQTTNGGSRHSPFDGLGQSFTDNHASDLSQHAEITIDLESAYTGDQYNIKLNVPVRLANGDVGHEQKNLKFTIPKGITEGKQIRLAGQGAVSLAGGSNGDLFLKVKIKTPDNIRLEGADVYQTVNIMPWEAAMGEKITLDSPAGSFDVNIPKNSASGSSLRLKGKGIPAKKAGDLYLVLNIVNPSANVNANVNSNSNGELTTEQKQAYQALKSAFSGISIQR